MSSRKRKTSSIDLSNTEWKCPDCPKILSGDGKNTTNIERHLKACPKISKLQRNQKTISSFFSKKPKTPGGRYIMHITNMSSADFGDFPTF